MVHKVGPTQGKLGEDPWTWLGAMPVGRLQVGKLSERVAYSEQPQQGDVKRALPAPSKYSPFWTAHLC